MKLPVLFISMIGYDDSVFHDDNFEQISFKYFAFKKLVSLLALSGLFLVRVYRCSMKTSRRPFPVML